MTSMLMFYQNTTKRHATGPPMHDPCAVAFLIDPSIFEYRLMYVDVETKSPLTSGMTVCDVNNYYAFADRPKNVNVCLKMNVEKFWGFMLDALSKANESSLKD
jgi:pyrimidine-specific ribonucleoside hydrolase